MEIELVKPINGRVKINVNGYPDLSNFSRQDFVALISTMELVVRELSQDKNVIETESKEMPP